VRRAWVLVALVLVANAANVASPAAADVNVCSTAGMPFESCNGGSTAVPVMSPVGEQQAAVPSQCGQWSAYYQAFDGRCWGYSMGPNWPNNSTMPAGANWTVAQTVCQSIGGNLASVHTARENCFILSGILGSTTMTGNIPTPYPNDAPSQGHSIWQPSVTPTSRNGIIANYWGDENEGTAWLGLAQAEGAFIYSWIDGTVFDRVPFYLNGFTPWAGDHVGCAKTYNWTLGWQPGPPAVNSPTQAPGSVYCEPNVSCWLSSLVVSSR